MHAFKTIGAAFLLATALPAPAAVIWTEAVDGDLSNNQASPTAFNLAVGVSSFVGTVGSGDTQDWLRITVAAGTQLSSLVLGAYISTDAQGFMGAQAGTAFVGSTSVPANYLGYAHFGTGATNGSLPPTNLIGADMLPIMGNNAVTSPGSQGFVPPLGPGTYAILLQQLGAATTYQFDFTITPEPGTAGLALLACGLLGRRRRG